MSQFQEIKLTVETLLKTYSTRNMSEAQEQWPHEVRQAILFLNKNVFNDLCSVSSMRAECRINQRNFSIHFRRYVGVTPVDYIVSHRIEAAKLLLGSDILCSVSIGDVGWSVGYENPSTFATVFKNRVGISPSDWVRVLKIEEET